MFKNQKFIFHLIFWSIGLFIIFIIPQMLLSLQTKELTYSEFKSSLKEGHILKAQISQDNITGLLFVGKPENLPKIKESLKEIHKKDEQGKDIFSFRDESAGNFFKQLTSISQKNSDISFFTTVRLEDPKLVEELDRQGMIYSGTKEGFWGQIFWGTLIPILFWVGLWFFLMRIMERPGAGILSIGKSKAKIDMEKNTGVTFSDVAGCDEAKTELTEVVQFLKEPEKFEKLGAKIPKGVLLLGPPGTGKTLLARALAGEADVPFFSISGSEFVEMFVGVGAARVRDLFNQAKQSAPCIIFIDEIDAIGKFRSSGMVAGGHEEREQTLNQLLVEMDGFEANKGVIILAATNRPEVLDPALMRPGRFDRQVILDAPDVIGRQAILAVHSRNKPLSKDIDLKSIAMRTPGFSGADLANVVNEAALLAARDGKTEIAQKYMEDAVEKVLAGPERKSRRLTENERKRVAYHEAGHAVVAYFCPDANPVAKISIIPRGKAALGYTLQLPEEERYIITKNELLDKICVSLGGRSAESVMYNELSTGAQNDLEIATEIARSMICRFGMSEKIGPVALSRDTIPYMRNPFQTSQTDGLSPDLISDIDKEVNRIMTDQEKRAMDIITQNKEKLIDIAETLLHTEVMSADEFKSLMAKN
jgi:cell division protease FtsH